MYTVEKASIADLFRMSANKYMFANNVKQLPTF